jgi:hypothetical protein
MNKTRRRAIQKHRAKEAKFDERRKDSGEANSSRARTPAAVAPAQSRAKAASRRQASAEAEE